VTIFSIGHSTRGIEEFVALLCSAGVQRLADIRTVPRSRRNPQFNREALPGSLGAAGIDYRHFPELGGLRHPRPDSRNTAWQNDSFRGYADYMATTAFVEALGALTEWAASAPTAMMCAEAVWWRCHRRLVADALIVRGIEVRHIVGNAAPAVHELTRFARVEGESLIYE
jgi:uncharacterized protein (DUF488 family)